jgi:hypothetical protein
MESPGGKKGKRQVRIATKPPSIVVAETKKVRVARIGMRP